MSLSTPPGRHRVTSPSDVNGSPGATALQWSFVEEETDVTASREPRDPARSARPPARLVVVHPPELAGAVVPLGARPLVLGRAAGEDTRVLEHATISRRHLAIEPSGPGWAARDLETRNGSAVDGEPLGPRSRLLADGDVVRIGDVLLVVELGAALAEANGAEATRAAIPGESALMREVRAAIARAAPDRAPVLVLGETGVGKERVAAELHRASGRTGAFVAVNCAALGRELMESELFGHVRGAFTGASDAQPGLFAAAHGGTLFLDEIGDLPLDLQPKLLRALQEGEVRPVGATRAREVEVRIVAATNQPLTARVEAGEFRRDLYARLALWEIVVPPLRRRRVDVLPWIARLYRDWHATRGLAERALVLRADAAEALLLAAWLENLRGVGRLVHELGASDRTGALERRELPAWLVRPEPAASAAAASAEPARSGPPAGRRAPPTREELATFLRTNGGSVHAAARHFERDRRQIYRWLDAYGLRDRALRGDDER